MQIKIIQLYLHRPRQSTFFIHKSREILKDPIIKMASNFLADKERFSTSHGSIYCNGTSVHSNYRRTLYTVANPDMCFFCFDVLHSYLYNYDAKTSLPFTNEK